ncbi:MAG: SOS response-associated peptidase family protein [Erythrobacter sp.]
MCNLYRLGNSSDEVAAWFSAVNRAANANVGTNIYPGAPGLVFADGQLRSMIWGFPLTLKSKKTGEPLKPKPVNNARSDKLETYMWRYSFEERRCLIPLNAWAEAEGEKGSKTRTWLSRHGADLFAVAGIWKDSDEWGPCYSIVMTDSAGKASEVHNRMPVVLRSEDYSTWLGAPTSDAAKLCRPFDGAIGLDRTDDPWVKRS